MDILGMNADIKGSIFFFYNIGTYYLGNIQVVKSTSKPNFSQEFNKSDRTVGKSDTFLSVSATLLSTF